MSVACYTAIFGGYDTLKPHPHMEGVDFYCFTDRVVECPGWEVIVVGSEQECFSQPHPRMQAKWFKLHPHLALTEYDTTVWVDGNQQILTEHYVDRCVAAISDSGLALHGHPEDRDCIYQEAPYSLQVHPVKYVDQPLMEQVDHYRNEGMPEHCGLWACGTLASRRSDSVIALMEEWWSHNLAWSYQDQLSFPFVCWKLGFTPSEFLWDQDSGTETLFLGHRSFT